MLRLDSIPCAEAVEQRSCPALADRSANLGRAATYLFFDGVECGDPAEFFGGCRRRVQRMDVMKLAPCMRPARCFVDVLAIEVMEAGISIGLKSAMKCLQVLPRMFALAIFGVGKPDRWSRGVTGRAVVAHIGPQPSCLRLTCAWRQHGNRLIVSVQLPAPPATPLERIDQSGEQFAAAPTQPATVARSLSTPRRA